MAGNLSLLYYNILHKNYCLGNIQHRLFDKILEDAPRKGACEFTEVKEGKPPTAADGGNCVQTSR